jgi:hypothetical protein
MLSTKPNRREFIKAAAVTAGTLLVPAGLHASQDHRSWFVHSITGESWPVSDPVSWCLENANDPTLKNAKEGLWKLTEVDHDRIIRLVTRRCQLNLVEIQSHRVAIHYWGINGQAELKPFFKTQGLAKREVEVVAINRKKETSITRLGDTFLFGSPINDHWPTELYRSKWEHRREQESDDSRASPKSMSGFAWEGVESHRIPWFVLKTAWQRTSFHCENCEQPTILTNFGQPHSAMFRRMPFLEHVCLDCRRLFKGWIMDIQDWLHQNLDPDDLPDIRVIFGERLPWFTKKLELNDQRK